jgi:hypothetical protein
VDPPANQHVTRPSPSVVHRPAAPVERRSQQQRARRILAMHPLRRLMVEVGTVPTPWQLELPANRHAIQATQSAAHLHAAPVEIRSQQQLATKDTGVSTSMGSVSTDSGGTMRARRGLLAKLMCLVMHTGPVHLKAKHVSSGCRQNCQRTPQSSLQLILRVISLCGLLIQTMPSLMPLGSRSEMER